MHGIVANAAGQTYLPSEAAEGRDSEPKKVLLWDRKAESGFPGVYYPEDPKDGR